MNIGYSFWGFLADIKLDNQYRPLSTPDGNAFYSWSIINALLNKDVNVIKVMPDRDLPAITAFKENAFSAWIKDARYRAYSKSSNVDYSSIDLKTATKVTIFSLFDKYKFNKILHEWRMPISGRNTLDCRDDDAWQPDLFIQECVLEYCAMNNIELFIFDLDYKLTDDDMSRFGKNVKILELGTKLKNATKVYIPFDFSYIDYFDVKPISEKKTSLVYIGNRYERDWCIDKYIPMDVKDVVVYGNWNESGRDSSSRWPKIDFRRRLQTIEMYNAYSDAVCTILLAKEDYCKYHFMTARIIEAIFYGTIPLFIEEYGADTIREYAGIYDSLLTVRSADDVHKKIAILSHHQTLYTNVITYLRARLSMMDATNFVRSIL